MGGGRVEAVALSVPSLCGRVQKIGETGIIVRDGKEFCPRVEGGIRPRRSGGGRPPTMSGRPCVGSWRTGPQTPYATTPRGGPL